MNKAFLKKLQTGDKQALNALFEDYGNKIYKSAIFLADSREEAEDIVQETFLKAIGSIQGFKGRSSLYTWLYRIFLNTTHDLRRKKYIHKKFISKFKPEENINPIEDLIGQMDNDTFSQSLNDALKCQKMKHREIIILRFFEDLKLIEIAEMLNVSIGTVKSRLYHALRKIKKSIKNIEHFINIDDQKYGGRDELQ
jgi:RNA polymerase sigma-70 factor (ECF subfamily)